MPKHRTALRKFKEINSAPHQIKASDVSGTKMIIQRYTGIYRYFVYKCFQNKWGFLNNCIVKWVYFLPVFNVVMTFCWKIWNYKINPKYHLFSGPKKFFFGGGTVLARFIQHSFKFFPRRPTMVADIFTQPPPSPMYVVETELSCTMHMQVK